MAKTRRVPWGTFKADDGSTVTEQTYARTVVKDGKVYKRVPKPKPKSRSDRLYDVISSLENLASELQEVADMDLDLEGLAAKANELLGQIDYSEVETLKGEMEEWRDNLSGANMEHLPKFEEVSEAYDALESFYDELEGFDQDEFNVADYDGDRDSLADAIRSRGEELETAAGSSDVNFPGMY